MKTNIRQLKTSVLLCFFAASLAFSPAATAQLFINEWMAANDNVIADNFGEYDDWIEIYNAGTTAIDLAGYFITDDPAGPDHWLIPTGSPALTTVPAGGFLLLWADNDLTQGAHHLGFKLSSNGEQIALYEPDGTTLVDEVTFGPQNSNTSSGRSPDGGANIQLFINSTPGTSNPTVSGGVTYNAMYEFPIIEGNDDAKQFESAQGWMNSNGAIIYMTESPSSEYVGLRFQNIEIPQGATINNAYIQFANASINESSGPCDLLIYGENIGHAPAYELAAANNIYDRPATSNTVNWSPPNWIVQNSAGLSERTPALTEIVQEIVDRSDWNSGNAMSFVISGTGTRTIWTYDGNPGLAAKVIIEIEATATNDLISDVFINEVASRGTDYVDNFGERDDWVELYNAGADDAYLGGLFLTDDLTDLTKWQIAAPLVIPPNEFATIWVDNDPEQGGLHASFNLSGAGEDLALVQVVDGAFQIIDQVTLGEVPFEASYGRLTDGAPNWVTFGNITPAASNNGSALWLAPPSISLDNGLYNSAQTVSISHTDPTVDIRYTTDGSEPTSSSDLYTSELTVTATQSLRAKAFKVGNFTESPSAIRNYLFLDNPNLPVLYLNTDPANFFDDETGIYVVGTNGIPGYCDQEPRNYCQEWTRPVNVTLFETDGAVGFNVNAGIKIGGGCSRNFELRSLNLAIKEKTYGTPPINYPLFEGRNTNKFEKLKLRNSGQDFVRMGFRDAAIQSLLWGEVDMELQGFKPVIVYVNDLYWGILNIRELYTDEYFEHIYGVKKEEIDLIKNPGLFWKEIKKGDDLLYNELYNYLEDNDLSVQDNYDYAASQIDINEFLNYWISSIYIAANDWPANNQVVWRERKADAKWRWGMFDNDNSTNVNFGPFSEPDFNTLDSVMDASHQTWPFHSNSTVFFRNLMDNTAFRDEYIQRTCTFSNILFAPERVNQITDEIQNTLSPEVESHIDRWGYDNAMGGSVLNWQTNIQAYKDFYPERQGYMADFINEQWNLSGTYQLTLNYDQNTGGTVVVNWNEMETPYNYQGSYFKNIPLQVKAVAKQGYTFLYWLETGDTNATIEFVSDTDATLTPIFQIDVDLGANIEICEGQSATISTGLDNCVDCIFAWSNNETTPDITVMPTSNTTYNVTVTDPGGVNTMDTIEVLVSPQIILTESITEPSVGASDGAISVMVQGGVAPFDYNWNTGQSGPDISNLSAGVYTVTVEDAYGCQFSASYEIGTVSTHQPDNVISILLYPNPSEGVFQIDLELKESRQLDITVFDAIGHEVFTINRTGKRLVIPVDLTNAASGLYFVEIKSDQERIHKKLLLRR